MSIKRIIYLVLAILGFLLPWYYNVQFFAEGTLTDFINQSSANLAAKSISLDLFVASLAGSTWMYLEGKKVGIKFPLLYILLGLFIAFGFAFPLFLFMRETQLEKLAILKEQNN